MSKKANFFGYWKKNIKYHFGFVILAAIIMYVFFYSALVISKKPAIPTQVSPTPTPVTHTLPKKNITVYTKCYGVKNKLDNCYIYAGSLYDETPAYLVFPTMGKGANIELNGYSGKNVIFTSTKNGVKMLSVVNIENGNEHDIYRYHDPRSDTKDTIHDGRIVSLFVDKENNSVYFTAEGFLNAKGQYDINKTKFMQFDLSSHKLIHLGSGSLNTGTYSDTFYILGGNSKELFLTVKARGGTYLYKWFKTYEIDSKKFVDVKEPKDQAVFDDSGMYVAYLKEDWIKNSNGEFIKPKSEQLIVDNVNGTDQKIIHTISNINTSGQGNYPSFVTFTFNPSSDTFDRLIMYSVSTGINTSHYYYAFLGIPLPSPTPHTGIVLMMDQDPNAYKKSIEISPPVEQQQNYQWTLFYDQYTPVGPLLKQGFLYKDHINNYGDSQVNTTWYIDQNPFSKDALTENDIIPVMTGAQQLLIIPSL